MDISQFARKHQDLQKRANSRMYVALSQDIEMLMDDLRNMSPIDSGEFKSRWFVLRRRSENKISMTVRNDTSYGLYLDEGARPGGAPWYWPKAKVVGNTSKSGKLIYAQGRVWAGGKSPFGHVVGGVTGKAVLDNDFKATIRVNTITEGVVLAIIGSI